jgi:hypothetical protein
MSFSWNKWRQYLIEEASVNEETDREIIDAAVDILGKTGQETHYLHRKFKEEGSDDIDGYDVSNARSIIRKGGKIMEETPLINPEAEEISPEDLEAASDMLASLAEKEDLQNTDRGSDRGFSIYDLGGDDEDLEEVEQDTIDMAVQNIDSPHGPSLEEDKFDNPGWDLEAIMGAFKDDFEEATRDTDDIVYAQERVIAAYKDVFAKSHPKLSREIDMYLNNKDAETRKMFQNVADDPEVVGRDMMREFRDDDGEEDFGGDPQDFGNDLESRFQFIAPRLARHPGKKEELKPLFLQMTDAMEEDDKVAFDDAFVKAMEMMGYENMLEIEGLVQTEIDAFDEAMNDMAIEKVMTATKLDALQNDLEATLSQEEIDALSDAIVLLRKKETVVNENQEDLDKNYIALAHEMGLKDLRPSPEAITDKWYKMNVEADLEANDVELRDFQWVMKYFFEKGADRDKLEALRKKVMAKAKENSTAKNREMFSYLYDKDGKLKPEYQDAKSKEATSYLYKKNT